MTTRAFSDGCHRYGWLITIMMTIVANFVMGAYLAGQQTQKLNDLEKGMDQRVNRLEQRLDQLFAPVSGKK